MLVLSFPIFSRFPYPIKCKNQPRNRANFAEPSYYYSRAYFNAGIIPTLSLMNDAEGMNR